MRVKKVISVEICPMCRSDNVIFSAGGVTGTHTCKSCGYVGIPVVERRVLGERQPTVEIMKHKTKKKAVKAKGRKVKKKKTKKKKKKAKKRVKKKKVKRKVKKTKRKAKKKPAKRKVKKKTKKKKRR